ncbi:guanylate kinase [Uliginosibacterium sp. sgz301328]|uniref:guanylate kinase n=1 Tax=Uliginosibacterium sp. sgz301328 TaxID=3243764 RepID=UPI00359D9D60
MTGILYIVSAPSGAGKTTLVRGLLATDPAVRLSISYTTRAPRTGEEQGVAYNFTDVQRFMAMREAGEFIEWAEVHGNYYATSAPWLRSQLEMGQDVLLEIDWQGAEQVKRQFADAVGIFIMPPSYEVLESRLRGRGTDHPDVIARRLDAARDEMRRVNDFDYVIINNDLQEATADLCAVVRAARLKTAIARARHPGVFLPDA